VAASLVPGRQVNIIDPAPAVARHLYEVMDGKGIIKREGYELLLHASGDHTVLYNLAESLTQL